MSELSKIEDETEFEPVDQGEETQETAADDGFEIEVIDDRPIEDRVPPRADPAETESEDEGEAAQYSERVQKRIKQLKYEYHEERRAKEEADRQREEAIAFAQQTFNDNQKLRESLAAGENVLMEQAKGRASAEVAAAKKAYTEAFNTGDPEAIADAQMGLTKAQAAEIQAEQYQPLYQNLPQQRPQLAPQENSRPKVHKPTRIDVEWSEKNPWFNKDDKMTAYAMGVHQDLVKNGVSPLDDPIEYYRQLDAEMLVRFPDKFGSGQEEAPRNQAGNVVAPAQRSASKSRKVQLTSTQVALAKRLGITPEQYAAQLLKQEQANG